RNTILTFFHGNGMSAAFHWLHESWGGDIYSAAMLGSLVLTVNAIQSHVPEKFAIAAVPNARDASSTQPRPLDF
ncbi:MAG: hypothetical protein AAGI45_08310, partial [Cyanobacteria bacterium P01_H01_bin.26]